MQNSNELKSKIELWCAALTRAAESKYVDEVKHLAPIYQASYGKKYIRIFTTTKGQNRAAFAFVDYEGNIYKCASWTSPAKGIRAHINNPPMLLRELYR